MHPHFHVPCPLQNIMIHKQEDSCVSLEMCVSLTRKPCLCLEMAQWEHLGLMRYAIQRPFEGDLLYCDLLQFTENYAYVADVFLLVLVILAPRTKTCVHVVQLLKRPSFKWKMPCILYPSPTNYHCVLLLNQGQSVGVVQWGFVEVCLLQWQGVFVHHAIVSQHVLFSFLCVLGRK